MELSKAFAIVATFFSFVSADSQTFEDSLDKRLLLSDPSHWQQEIQNLQSKLQAITSDYHTMAGQIQTHTAEIQALKSENTALKTTKAALESSIRQVESSYNSISNQLFFSFVICRQRTFLQEEE